MTKLRSRVTIRRADLTGNGPIVIRPEIVGSREKGPITLRREDLPGVPCVRPIGARPIRIHATADALRAEARRMLDLINIDRATHHEESGGARPLQWDDAIAAVALAHCEDMLAQRYMAHLSPQGLAPLDRLRRAGLHFLVCGENIAGSPTVRVMEGNPPQERIWSGYPSTEDAEAGLMNSPGHRHNVLQRAFTHVGVGIVRNPDGTLVITQNFLGRDPLLAVGFA